MTTGIDTDARGLAAPWFGLMTLPNGISQGFVTVTLGYILTLQGLSVAAVAGMIGFRGHRAIEVGPSTLGCEVEAR